MKNKCEISDADQQEESSIRLEQHRLKIGLLLALTDPCILIGLIHK
jgi:hypothetical protein